jgi:hypothetical protein
VQVSRLLTERGKNLKIGGLSRQCAAAFWEDGIEDRHKVPRSPVVDPVKRVEVVLFGIKVDDLPPGRNGQGVNERPVINKQKFDEKYTLSSMGDLSVPMKSSSIHGGGE